MPRVDVDFRSPASRARSRGRAFAGVAAIALALVAGCGGGGKARIPVDSPLRPWQPPAAEELAEPTDAAPDTSAAEGSSAPGAPR